MITGAVYLGRILEVSTVPTGPFGTILGNFEFTVVDFYPGWISGVSTVTTGPPGAILGNSEFTCVDFYLWEVLDDHRCCIPFLDACSLDVWRPCLV